MDLKVGQIVDDTQAEGPGRRFAVWTAGCSIRCPGCCNPHLFSERAGTEMSVAALLQRAGAVSGIEGVSVLGGEPFDQPDALAELCEGAAAQGLTVMVFTGFTLQVLRARPESAVARALAAIDLLVDGPYLQAHPETRRRWVGSTNQQVHFLTERGRSDAPRFEAANTVEIRWSQRTLSVNGWPAASKVVQRW